MKHPLKVAGLATALCALFCVKANAQNVLVSGATVGNGSYATVGAAFTAINSGAQTGATITVALTGNTTEAATATLSAGTWTSLSIVPTGGGARTVSGSIAGPLFDFDGADRVGIDGINSGGNSLTFDNTNTGAASTIRFINDADMNAVQRVTILGAGTSTGTVFFSTGVSTGNDSIVFSNCTIDASTGGNPTNGVNSVGSAGMENGTITFTTCNIANFFNAGAVSVGINVGANNTLWSITGCRFYQSTTRTYTTGGTHAAVRIASGDGHLINNNIIGYATSAATGTYTMAGTVATRFIGIDLAVGTNATTVVTGNTITAFSLATSSGAATTNGIWCGVNMTAGNIICTVNTIGGASGAGLVSCVPTSTQGAVVGFHSSSTGTIGITSNTIGGLQSSGATAAVAGACFGINISGGANGLTIAANTIGNTTADNMRGGTAGLTTGSSLCAGINITTNPTANATISANTIQNFSSYGTGTGGYVRGIATPLSTSTTMNYTVTGNTITNLTTSGALTSITSGQVCAAGIQFFAAGGSTVAGNTITNISCINTGTTNTIVAGITLAATGTAGDNTISHNTIYNLSHAGTGTSTTAPPTVAGIAVRSGAANQYNIQNNMISLGAGQTTNTLFVGIWGNHGSTPNPVSVNIRYNTINIEGTAAAGALPSFGIHRGDFTATQRSIPYDIKNNLITNTRSGGTGAHYAIGNNLNSTSSNTGWPANASNNNVLNANAATVGYWTSAQTFAGWQTASAGDGSSYSGITVTYVNSASNLHLNMGLTATVIESGAQVIAAVTNDFDGQVRPGPVGSVNGGGTIPDIGADEFDGVPLDLTTPAITYTALTFTCATTDRTLTANIIDASGVPTIGTLRPRIYFRKNAAAWQSNPGTLTSGTGQNGTWDFIISTVAMGGLTAGDVVSYYVIAQDIAPTPNIGSNPSAGLVATDVNTVTTPPTTPNSYPVSGFLSGTYTVGVSGNYATLTDAVNAYNVSCMSGAVTFLLIDATYPSETFPITINANPGASAVNTLTIRPQNAGTVITGSATCLIKLNGADYVTIDGSANSMTNSYCAPVVSSARDLTIANTSTTSLSSAIWISSLGTGAGATHNTIRNCVISCGVDQSATATETYDIVSCGATVTAFPPSDGLDNSYNVVENNTIERATWGVYLRGGASSSNRGNVVRQNTIGGSAFGSTQLRKGGIILQNQDSASVIANEVRFVGNQIAQSVGGTDHVGIGLGGADGPTPTATNVTNSSVLMNNVHDIVCEKTFSAIGIQIAANNASASNNVVANNFIYNVRTNATSPDQGIGINVANGNGDKVVFNSISMVAADRDPASATTATQSDIGVRFQAGALNILFENNIIHVDEASNTTSLLNFAVVAPSAAYTWNASNYNDYSVNAGNPQMALFGLGTTGTIPPTATLAAWQATFTPAQDANSVNVTPVFVSATDLHLNAALNPSLMNIGIALPAIATTDMDCETRSSTPEMGADETCMPGTITTVTAVPPAICFGGSTVLTVAGSLNESSDWAWYSGSCGATPEATGTSVTVVPGSTMDYYVRAEGGCAASVSCSTITIIVNPLPTVGATPTAVAVCDGNTATLSGSGAVSYVWSGPETVTDNTPFTPTMSGTYVVTGTDANGCMDTASAVVTVNALPSVDAGAFTTVCTGNAVTFAGSGATSYAWSGPESVTDNVPFVPTMNGTYTVTGTDANGCSASDTASVVLNALPAVAANIPSQTVCAGNSVVLAGSGAVSYSWNGPETVTDNVAFVPTVNGTYTVTGTDANGCVNTDTAAVTVNALPNVTYAEPVDTACQTVATFALSGESPAGGTWSGPGVSGSMFDAMAANLGYNVITYTYVDSLTGCQNMTMDSIWVDLCLTVNALSTNSAVAVYPNPNNGTFTVSVNAACAELSIEIMNVEGKTIFSNQHSNVNAGVVEQIDLSSFANGTYFVKVVADGQMSVMKMVKSE